MRKNKFILVFVILLLLFIIFTGLDSMGAFTTTIIPLKSIYATFTGTEEVITEVKLTGPFKHNIIELYTEEKKSIAPGGNSQKITTYNIDVKKTLFKSNYPTIQLKHSNTIEYIYIFNFSDKTITVKNGEIVD